MTALSVLNNNDDVWTLERLVDELFYSLSFDYYYEQAQTLMYKIPVRNPPPPFQIRLSDLHGKVLFELEMSKTAGRKYALTQAAGHIFENINYNYFHLSVKRKLTVELVDQ